MVLLMILGEDVEQTIAPPRNPKFPEMMLLVISDEEELQ